MKFWEREEHTITVGEHHDSLPFETTLKFNDSMCTPSRRDTNEIRDLLQQILARLDTIVSRLPVGE